jgi:hypothetical protein
MAYNNLHSTTVHAVILPATKIVAINCCTMLRHHTSRGCCHSTRSSGGAKGSGGKCPRASDGGVPKEGGSAVPAKGDDKYDICPRAPEILAPPLPRSGKPDVEELSANDNTLFRSWPTFRVVGPKAAGLPILLGDL